MHSIAWWPTLIVLAIATFTDLRSRRIPNWLVLPFMCAGVGSPVGSTVGAGLAIAWQAWDWARSCSAFFAGWAAWAWGM